MAYVGVTVLEQPAAIPYRLHHARRRQHGADRLITAPETLGDETIAPAETELRLGDGDHGSITVDDWRAEYGRSVRFLADCFGEFGKRRRNILLQGFRFGTPVTPSVISERIHSPLGGDRSIDRDAIAAIAR